MQSENSRIAAPPETIDDPLVTAVITAPCAGVVPVIGAGRLVGIVAATDLARSPATGPHTRPGAR
jgi:CBS domain-containing protein